MKPIHLMLTDEQFAQLVRAAALCDRDASELAVDCLMRGIYDRLDTQDLDELMGDTQKGGE